MDAAQRLAHDLNNIAFVVYGYAQRLEEAMDASDPRREDVQAILAEIPRLTGVVDRIRALVETPELSTEVYVPSRQRRILLVEDEAAVRDLLRLALERRGYHVDTGSTGEEALALCDAIEPPDLLITDLIMPDATGPLIAARLRRRAPRVKVLLMSGYAKHPVLDAAYSAGECCLVKPFEIASFNDAVAGLLGEKMMA